MSTDIEPKLLDFMHRLFTIASVDPAALEAFKGCEMVVEIRFADCPKANLQIEAHQDKITVHKGAVKEPTLIMEYVAVQILKHCLEGRESYMVALLINSEILVTLGGNDDVVFFLEHGKTIKDSMDDHKKRVSRSTTCKATATTSGY